MLDFPEVELKIRGMERTILAAIQDYNKDIEQKVKDEVAKVISTYDFEKEVKEQSDQALKNLVGDAVNVLIGWELRKKIEEMVREQIVKKLNKKDETA